MAHEKILIAVLGVLFLVVMPVWAEEIHDAARQGDVAEVESLLAEKPEKINVKDKDDNTPLHCAVSWSQKDVAELLIAKGADVNAKGEYGFTPLHSAARNGQKDIAEFLIAKGAYVNAKDKDGQTPLHYAAKKGQKDVAELLIAKGADVNAKDKDGYTPLHYAAKNGQKDVSELLITKGADVNAKTKYGQTPMYYAVTWGDKGYKDVSELLIAKGADVNAKDKDGYTPLHYAAKKGQKDVAELLIAKGADVNAKDKDDYTPLHYSRNKDVSELLIDKGADVNAKRPQIVALMMKMSTRSDLGMRLDIKFDYNSDNIRIESYHSLDDIAEYMKSSQRQNVKFIIEGHTDERGTAEYNKLLSQKRAESTKRYLVEKHGIDPDRLITRGFGEERPLNRAHNEQAWAKNRRVMLKAESMNKTEVTLSPKNQENINIIMFANTSSKNTQIRKKLSRLTSNLVFLQSFPEVLLVSVVTDEDCTRNEVSKKLKKDKGKINIIILVGDILYNSSNRPYFKTIDTDLDILEDSAVSISQIREKLVGGQDSIIVVTNHLINFSGDSDLRIKEKRRAIPMVSVETPIESQLGLLDKLIQKMKTDLSGGIQGQPLLESIISFCSETRNSWSANGQ